MASPWAGRSWAGRCGPALLAFAIASACAPQGTRQPWSPAERAIDERIAALDGIEVTPTGSSPSPSTAASTHGARSATAAVDGSIAIEWDDLPSGRVALVPLDETVADETIEALARLNAALDRFGPPPTEPYFSPQTAASPGGRSIAVRVRRADGTSELVVVDDWRDPRAAATVPGSIAEDRGVRWPRFLSDAHLHIDLGHGRSMLLQRGDDGQWKPVELGATPVTSVRIASDRRVAVIREDGRVAFGTLDATTPDLDAALAAGALIPPCAPVTDAAFAQGGAIIVLAHETDATTASIESYRFLKEEPNRVVPVSFVAARAEGFGEAFGNLDGDGGGPTLLAARDAQGRPAILAVAPDGALELVAPRTDGGIGRPSAEWSISGFTPDGSTAILQRASKFRSGSSTAGTPIARTPRRADHAVTDRSRSPWLVWFVAAP